MGYWRRVSSVSVERQWGWDEGIGVLETGVVGASRDTTGGRGDGAGHPSTPARGGHKLGADYRTPDAPGRFGS